MSRSDLTHLNLVGNYDFDAASSSNSHDESDLSLFSNTQFFDFDMGRSMDMSTGVDDLLVQQEKYIQKSAPPPATATANGDFQYPLQDGGAFAAAPQYATASSIPLPPHQLHGIAPASSTKNVEPANKKRKVSETPSQESESPEGDKSVTAEEDKRRRNTAASARFRMKKKQREQEMERASKEMQEKLSSLERKVLTLEMENQWLRKLVVEKNEARDQDTLMAMKKEALGEAAFN